MGVISNVNGTFTKQCRQSHSKIRSDESGTRCADAMGLTLSGSTQKSSSVRWCLVKHQLWRSPSVFIQPWKITSSDEAIKVEGGSHDYERKNTHSPWAFPLRSNSAIPACSLPTNEEAEQRFEVYSKETRKGFVTRI